MSFIAVSGPLNFVALPSAKQFEDISLMRNEQDMVFEIQ